MGNQLTQCIELANSAASVLSSDGKSSTAASFIGPDTLKKLNVNEEVIQDGIKALSELVLKPKLKPAPAPRKPKDIHNVSRERPLSASLYSEKKPIFR